jgi:predicted Rossmann-fold nucleotide-binding protein
MVNEGFLKQEYREMIIADDNPDILLKKMENYVHPVTKKIVDTVASINHKKNE